MRIRVALGAAVGVAAVGVATAAIVLGDTPRNPSLEGERERASVRFAEGRVDFTDGLKGLREPGEALASVCPAPEDGGADAPRIVRLAPSK